MKTSIAILAVAAVLAAGPAFAQGKSGEHRSENAGGSGGENRNIAALAGAANAAHASPTALGHANSKSMVGKVQAYAELQETLDTGELQQDLVNAQAAFDALYPDFETMSDADRMAALETPEGQALIAAQRALEQATEDRDLALAALGKNATDPAVQAHIDSLLAD